MFLNNLVFFVITNKHNVNISDKGPQKREKQTKIDKIKYNEGNL